jgi:CHAT domain-containing protein
MPFEALIDEKDHYLLENYAVSYVSSGRDLLRMQDSPESRGGPLVVADPDFGEPPSELVGDTAASRRPRTQKRGSITITRSIADTYFAPLAATAREARAIQQYFPTTTVLTGEGASETAVKQLRAPSILHLATHGFFLTDIAAQRTDAGLERSGSSSAKPVNPLLRSGLAFAGANKHGGGTDDGILTALEASGLDLWGTKLVVLSACDTGLGEVRTGEGVYGLRRSFSLAGSQSLVMSLWPVSDYVTRELMEGFYKNLKNGDGRSESLRRVQLEMVKRPARSHPFYWASFIESGDWRSLGSGK